MEKFLKFFPLVKIDEAAHTVWGIVTSETPDSDREICDYDAAKVAIKSWSDDQLGKTVAAGQDPSLGNMRVMHQLQIGGKAIKIEYRDDAKQVWVGSEPANEDVWHLLKGGFLTGHSIGGSYLWKKAEGQYTRYAPTIGEISYVDKGSNPDASFAYVKADGTTELRKFATPGPAELELMKKIKAASLANLSEADVDRIVKALADSLKKDGLDLDTRLEKIQSALNSFVRETTPGANDMNPEQVKKCAAALGISEEEFKKLFASAPDLEKAKSGLAALHAHIETAHDHHEGMHKAHSDMVKAHSAMSAMHEKHTAHLQKAMKACKAVMGSDEKEADKAIKDLLAKLVPAGDDADAIAKKAAADKAAADAAAAAAAASGGTFTKADVEKMIKEALDKAPANDASDRAKLFAVPRETAVKKAAEDKANSDPLPV